MPAVATRPRASRAAALVLAATAAGLLGASTPALAATPVAGTYTLHYEWYSAPGFYQTTQLVLSPDHTCSVNPGCAWNVSNGAFTMTLPNPRRLGVTYSGVVTTPGLNTSAQQGYMYSGSTGSQHQGRWYATKP